MDVVEQVFPSGGNFLLTKLRVREEEAERLADALLIDHGIYVRSISSKFADGGTTGESLFGPQMTTVSFVMP